MNNNVFLISDASYSHQTKCTGIGVVDLSSKRKYSFRVNEINSTYEAEYRALLMSVRIALKKGYQNVVFVYDHQTLDIEPLKQYLNGKIRTFQFLWLKRGYVNEADRLAKNARSLQEMLQIKSIILDGDGIYKAFTQHGITNIVKSFMIIANKEEKIFLKAFLANEVYAPLLITDENLELFKLIYHFLKDKQKKRFLKFVDNHYAKTLNKQKFNEQYKKIYYVEIIQEILKKLQDKRKNDIYEKQL